MKTVSTKVDESVYQKLVDSCGKSGNCISERIRGLIENSLGSETPISKELTKLEEKHEPHYDKFGNYYTYNLQTKLWTCKLNPRNVRIIL